MTLKASFYYFFFSILCAILAMAFGGLLFIYSKSTMAMFYFCVTNFLLFRGLHMVLHTARVLVSQLSGHLISQ